MICKGIQKKNPYEVSLPNCKILFGTAHWLYDTFYLLNKHNDFSDIFLYS